MDVESYIGIFLFLILAALSAFFSGSEASFFSLSKEMIERLKEGSSRASRRIVRLLEKPRFLLITILIGNMLSNVAAVTIAAFLTADVTANLNFPIKFVIIIQVAVVALILLIFSELIPKIFAVKNSFKFATIASIPLQIIGFFVYPIVIILDNFPTLISGLMTTRVKEHLLSKEELNTLLEVSEEKGALEEDEKEMIHSIFEFSKTTVKEIMVPRIDMVCVEKGTPLNELIDIIKTKGHTRIPLYDDKVDNILGIIHAKELLPFINDPSQKVDLVSFARTALFVPESKLIDELLKDFQIEKQHMAIVVDEYGGTAGLITLENVIEEIVGEIQDEYDREKPLFKKIDDNRFLVDAKIDLDELNSEMDMNLPVDQSYESLGGFIFNQIGSVPEIRQEIEYDKYKFIIEKIDRNRILQVLIIKSKPADESLPGD